MRTPRTPHPDPFDLPGGPHRRGDHPRGGRGRRGGFDVGWETGPRGGRGPGAGGPGGRRGGSRRGRGQMRAAILLLLAEAPQHGYQIITELADRSEGGWRPSPGAVYPAIAQLQDEGLVEVADDGGRRLASLTDAGREHVEAHRDELGTPWAPTGPRGPGRELHGAMRSLAGAVEQVARTGTPEQATAAAAILAGARRDLYLLLAGE
ncbi:PadR family transcriptional regulator [Isoptericola sp. CG 20/1183]|uniref:PadR family transcriptional regulator n=1 Tax=Isoptericola halotolerans TaxID=300560 RepID=A0ABX5EJR5_9MICO|nr:MULTISPECIES: PadR family transcriptional regulator [Isoptericola]PRZ08546.1 PadR family transcriptional regulator [Isoptericola halotolerans]PRZ11007.1 PadR family transcriptional regulator [Isoptericola sp. CG 20/1183]